jgi:hypothetical protein
MPGREARTDRRCCGPPDDIDPGYDGEGVVTGLRRYAEEIPRVRECVAVSPWQRMTRSPRQSPWKNPYIAVTWKV